ncbi:MAG: portal protein [Rhabdochlamydiaceae bacterium]
MANSFKLFGFEITRPDKEKQLPPSVVSPIVEDGAINIQSGAHYGIYVDLDGSYRSEVDLLSKYRTMAMQPEMESAIEDIINDAIISDEKGKVVSLILDDLDQPDEIKGMIRDEFDNVLRLIDFNNFGSEIFRRWYIDGRLYYSLTIDPDNPRDGIQSITYVDPRRIRKIRNIVKKKNDDGVEVIDHVDEFYLYNEKIVNNNIQSPQIIGNYAGGTKLAKDSVIYMTSGLFDPAKSTVLSYLHKAIRPMNQLRFMEDAIVIYTISRAPERRVFYVDVGGMPRAKAEQYLHDIMNKYRNRLVYDSGTGEIRNDVRHLSILEDFWMPRTSSGRTTEIQTLPAGQGLTQNDIIKYFEMKLYHALGVPVSRMEPNQGFSLGRSNEITRDEIKFDKYIKKLRNRFSIIFDELMARQLALKGVCTLDEWNQFKQDIQYKFQEDNHFEEMKEGEILSTRLNILNVVTPYVGQYYSKRWVQENILYMDESLINKMNEEMSEEQKILEKENKRLQATGVNPMTYNKPIANGEAGSEAGQGDLNNMVQKQFV